MFLYLSDITLKLPKYATVLYPMKSVPFLGSLEDDKYFLRPYKNMESLANENDHPKLIDAPETKEKVHHLNNNQSHESNKEVLNNAEDFQRKHNTAEDNIQHYENVVSKSVDKMTEPVALNASEISKTTEPSSIAGKIKNFVYRFLKNMHSGFDGIDRGAKK
jgi:hypothetical protein